MQNALFTKLISYYSFLFPVIFTWSKRRRTFDVCIGCVFWPGNRCFAGWYNLFWHFNTYLNNSANEFYCSFSLKSLSMKDAYKWREENSLHCYNMRKKGGHMQKSVLKGLDQIRQHRWLINELTNSIICVLLAIIKCFILRPQKTN